MADFLEYRRPFTDTERLNRAATAARKVTMNNFETGETYIGDGVYASFDGWQIRLRVPLGINDAVIFLQPGVWSSLVDYAGGLNRKDADSVLCETPNVRCRGRLRRHERTAR